MQVELPDMANSTAMIEAFRKAWVGPGEDDEVEVHVFVRQEQSEARVVETGAAPRA